MGVELCILGTTVMAAAKLEVGPLLVFSKMTWNSMSLGFGATAMLSVISLSGTMHPSTDQLLSAHVAFSKPDGVA